VIVEFNRESNLPNNPPVFYRTFGDNGLHQGIGGLCLDAGASDGLGPLSRLSQTENGGDARLGWIQRIDAVR
jgi:hypothetical protein